MVILRLGAIVLLLSTVAGNAQPIAPTRTFGAPLPTLVPPQRPGMQLTPQTKPTPTPAEGVGVATSPGLPPPKPLEPFVSQQNMPTIAGRQKHALAADDGDGELRDRTMTNKNGYGLSWYNDPQAPDTAGKVKVPVGIHRPDPEIQ